jgi:hypothetical protein
MNKMVKIYCLIDPRDNLVRYVGYTTSTLQLRLNGHMTSIYTKKRTHKINWIFNLKSVNLKPTIHLLEEVEFEYGWDAEKYWIEQFKHWGFKLTNSSEGGEVPLTKPGKDNPNYGNKYNENAKTTKGRVVQLDLKGNYIRTLKCRGEGELYGINPGNISACLLGKRNQHKDFQFILECDYDPNHSYIFKPKNTQIRPINQYDLQGKFIQEFPSVVAANKYFNVPKSKIYEVCLGKRNTCFGYKWKYKE